MSVLSFPRIYFKGFMEWDPCTFNNNDWHAFQTYDGEKAALNWSFLATQAVTPQNPQGITPDNFTTTFRPWAIELQADTDPKDNPPNGPPGPRVPAEWNMFGGHGVSFVQYPANDFTTTIIGGDTGYDQPVTSDPLIGGPVSIGSPGRLIDTNPYSFWSSQVYLDELAFGGGDYVISGTPSLRMHSRWLNLSRIFSTDQSLTNPAAGVACCFQAGIPSAQINWPASIANSTLASQLQQAASGPNAQGIMIRFTAYVNLYFQNGNFNNISTQPRDYMELADLLNSAWSAWNNNGDTSQFFSNPCYSHIVGVIGVWNQGELATVPGGRYLSAVNAVAPPGAVGAKPQASAQHYSLGHHVMKAFATDDPPATTLLGPLVASVDYDAELISLDLNNTMPENGTPGEWPSDLSKTDFGSLDLGVVDGQGNFTHIVYIDFAQYQNTAYEARAGIIDIPFPDSGTTQLLQNGALAIQVQGQTALQEQTSTAQTDSRGIYLDEGGQTSFDISVCQMGVPSPGINVLIAQYDKHLSLVPTNSTQYVNFTSGSQTTITVGGITTAVTVVTADANGIASVGIAAQNPGFPVLAFFPFTGDTLPQPPTSLLGPAGPLITYAFYTTVRVLPFDDAVPGNFVDVWNVTNDPMQAWAFVYFNILYVYDMLFSVMLKYVNLGSQSEVEGSISAIWSLISYEAAQNSTSAMPITRDMSAGKRLALQLWIYLVANNYNVQNFNVDSIPLGWSPPSN
jgi:hypothetical protein